MSESSFTSTPALVSQAARFSLPPDAHYLNCAYMSPLLKRAEEAGFEGMRGKRFPAEIVPDDFFSLPNRTRELFARLIGAREPLRVAILPAVSYGMAIAANNLTLSPKQKVVVVAEQFPSNMLAWRRRCRETGAKLCVVESPPVPRGEELSARIVTAIDDDTAAVAIGTVHWTDGTRYDLAAISARAREVGAALILDGTQSVGAAPFDLAGVQPDALICAAYKWLLGPYSVAFGWFGPRFDDGRPLEETWIARAGSERFGKLVDYVDEYRPYAERFDVGERSNFILLPMVNAALEQLLEWRVDRISRYCDALTAPLFDEVAALGFRVETPEWRSPHLFGLTSTAERGMERLETRLRDRHVHVSCRGRTLRVAPHLYNDAADIDALLDALAAD